MILTYQDEIGTVEQRIEPGTAITCDGKNLIWDDESGKEYIIPVNRVFGMEVIA